MHLCKEVLRFKSITSFFNFKKNTAKVFSQEKVSNLIDYAKNLIIAQVDSKLTNTQKKQHVDLLVQNYIIKHFTSTNVLLRFIIKVLVDCVPKLTQHIYDMLKQRVDGLTKE